MSILDGLNPAQREAVTAPEGPLLILAGPGSGKTRVIAHRIAYVVDSLGVAPPRILAVTFTNKAARELRDRAEALLGARAGHMTLGTFHAVSSRILRIEGERVGVPRTFAIYDDSDQLALMKRAMEEYQLDPRQHPPRAVLAAISRAKSDLATPETFARSTKTYSEEIVARLFERYQRLLEESSALDFDDILCKAVHLFREHEEVRERYRERYRHVLIDEFQDTNVAQYVLARLLAPPPDANICVVGDPDQSIYSWRAADIRNILGFERDYPKAKVVRLEQNYRSTQTILDGAQRVIAHNRQRKEKALWTERGRGDPIVVYEAYNAEEEAGFVASEVRRLVAAGAARYGDIAVMYRTNAQSRALEERLVQARVPYRLVGGARFYERKEVKDILAYLRLVLNPFDSVSLDRVINVPPRRIGDRTLEELTAWAGRLEIPIYAALQVLAGEDEGVRAGPGPFAPGGRVALLGFLGLLNEFIREAPVLTLSRLLALVVERTGYHDYLAAAYPGDAEERWDNVQELRAVAAQFDDLAPEHALMRFLEDTALMSDTDTYDERVDAVTLITLHAAKGLEFPVVMIVGMEEGLLPHFRSLELPEQIEEERRLAYVGVTRAKDRLYLLRAFRRQIMGESGHHPPSRFLKDLPEELVHFAQQTVETAYSGPRPSARWDPTPLNGRDGEPRRLLHAGERVRHASFGEGIVVTAAATAGGGDQEVTVAFKGAAGLKKLLLSFAPLERLD